ESGKFGVGDRRFGDPEWRDLDRMRPLFIVEDETIRGSRAELPFPTRHIDIACQCAGTISCWIAETLRARIAERLSRIGKRLDVHILVANGKVVEVVRRKSDPAGKPIDLAREHVGHRSEEHTSELQSPYDLVCRL